MLPTMTTHVLMARLDSVAASALRVRDSLAASRGARGAAHQGLRAAHSALGVT